MLLDWEKPKVNGDMLNYLGLFLQYMPLLLWKPCFGLTLLKPSFPAALTAYAYFGAAPQAHVIQGRGYVTIKRQNED